MTKLGAPDTGAKSWASITGDGNLSVPVTTLGHGQGREV